MSVEERGTAGGGACFAGRYEGPCRALLSGVMQPIADEIRLIGVSAISVYNWETGKTRSG